MLNHKVLEGDRYFRSGEYEQAISAYIESLKLLKEKNAIARVQTSIELCRRYSTIRKKTYSYFHVDSLLKDDIMRVLSESAKEKIASINGPVITEESKIDGREITRRISVSPYQTSLLLLIAKLTEELGLTEVIGRDIDKTDERDLLIGDIVRCIIDPLYEKQLETAVTSILKKDNIDTSALKNLQSNYKSFKELANIEQIEMFLRNKGNPKTLRQAKTGQNHPKTKKETTIYAGSIFLNEKKFLEKCLLNHYSLVSKWCLVEGTCLGYPSNKVSDEGYSKDFSSLILELFPDPENKIHYIPHGWTASKGEDAKSELRNRYLNGALGDALVVIDIDEFYPKQAFEQAIKKVLDGYNGVTVPQIHFWKNTKNFIIGGYYDISHIRFFKMHSALKYVQNHNFPETPDGVRLDKKECFKFKRELSSKDLNAIWSGVYCYHMGFSKDEDDMKDKTEYYVNRGEKDTRPETTKSRAAWFTNEIPENCQVLPFNQKLYGVLAQCD